MFAALVTATWLASAATASPPRYFIDATIDGRTIAGTVRIELDVPEGDTVRDVMLRLYPNRYLEALPGVNDINFVRVYPRRFEPAGIEVDQDDIVWLDEAGFAPRTLVRVPLPDPVAGGSTAHVEIKFETEIPEKFGTFGSFDSVLFANGGWYPALVARRDGQWRPHDRLPEADYDVIVRGERDKYLFVDDQIFDPGRSESTHVTVRTAYLFVGVTGDIHRHVDGRHAVVQVDRGGRKLANRQLEVWHDAREWYSELLSEPVNEPVTVYELPMPRQLVFHDAPVPVVTDRIYRVSPPLRRYHDLHSARAYFDGVIADRVHERESDPVERLWVREGVADVLADSFWHENGGLKDPRSYVRTLSWMPAVDLVLYSARFPFVHEYYGNYFWTDPLRDDPTLYGNRRPSGRVLLEKLRDRIGTDALIALIATYLTSDRTLREVIAEETDVDVDELYQHWRSPLVPVNYSVNAMDVQKAEKGWNVKVDLERDGPAQGDPVDVRIKTRKGNEEVVWEPTSDEESIEVHTRGKPKRVVVDPGARMLEPVKWDNRMPREWKFVLQYAYVDFDFKIQEASAAAGLEFQRTWDPSNEVDISTFVTQESLGAHVGYVRSFGRESWYRGLLHRLGVSLLAERLDKAFAKDGLHVIPGFDPLESEVDASLGLLASYRYDDRVDWRWPRNGKRFSIAVEAGTGLPVRAQPYLRWSSRFVYQRALGDNHVVAGQVKAGSFLFTPPRGIPLPKLFFIGGVDNLRGMSEPEVVGPARFLVSGEYRWFAIRNLDWDFWAWRVRGFQPTVFADLGYVSADVGTVPAFEDWYSDVGLAMRVHFDMLGVRPMLLRIDFAQRIDTCFDGNCGVDVRFYLGLGQSF